MSHDRNDLAGPSQVLASANFSLDENGLRPLGKRSPAVVGPVEGHLESVPDQSVRGRPDCSEIKSMQRWLLRRGRQRHERLGHGHGRRPDGHTFDIGS
jgi:hypothetical protein